MALTEEGRRAASHFLRDGRPLAHIRKSRGMTQAELAERMGEPQSRISDIEQRLDDLDLGTLRD